jgi:hypothetical protein
MCPEGGGGKYHFPMDTVEPSPSWTPTLKPQVVHETIDGETVVIDPASPHGPEPRR